MQIYTTAIVRVANVRSAYGRKGMVTTVTGGGKNRKATVRFIDVPRLSPQELSDPTGLVCTFSVDDLELVELEDGGQNQ